MAERRLAKAQIPTPRTAASDQEGGLGKRIEKILDVAKSEAEEIKEQARKESEKLLAAAEKTAADAEKARVETERAAHQEAQQVISRAEEEAATIRATHGVVLAELGQIADVVEELRDRFGGEVEVERPAETSAADPVSASAGSTNPG